MGQKGKKGKGKGKVSFSSSSSSSTAISKLSMYSQSYLVSQTPEIKESRYLCDHVHVPSSSLGVARFLIAH